LTILTFLFISFSETTSRPKF